MFNRKEWIDSLKEGDEIGLETIGMGEPKRLITKIHTIKSIKHHENGKTYISVDIWMLDSNKTKENSKQSFGPFIIPITEEIRKEVKAKEKRMQQSQEINNAKRIIADTPISMLSEQQIESIIELSKSISDNTGQ